MNFQLPHFNQNTGIKNITHLYQKLADKAKTKGADLISFHEMFITAYTQDLSLEQLTHLA